MAVVSWLGIHVGRDMLGMVGSRGAWIAAYSIMESMDGVGEGSGAGHGSPKEKDGGGVGVLECVH
jgi:hypothetical protein